MSNTPLNHAPSMVACMWSDYNGELSRGEHLQTSFANAAPRRFIPCEFRSKNQVGVFLSTCGVTLNSADCSDDDSVSDLDAESTDSESHHIIEAAAATPLPSISEPEVPTAAVNITTCSLKRKLEEDNEEETTTNSPAHAPTQASKRPRMAKSTHVFSAENDELILRRLTQSGLRKALVWKELSERFECSVKHVIKHYEEKLKPLLPPAMAHLSALQKDAYIKQTVKRWGSDEHKHHWESLAKRLGLTASAAKGRWEELKGIDIATRVQQKKNVRQVVRASDPIYSAAIHTTPISSSSSSLMQSEPIVVSEPEASVVDKPAPEATAIDASVPSWYSALLDSQASEGPQEEAVLASTEVSKMDVDCTTEVRREAPAPSTPTHSPYQSQEDTLGAEYWRTVASSRDRDAYIMSELKGSASIQDCARLAAQFGWSIEAVKCRWKQLNPNRWKASPGLPKPKARNLGFGLTAARIGAPKTAPKQNKSADQRATLTEIGKDAILIRTVRTANSTACPVNWKYLSGLYERSIEETKSYYNSINVSKRTDEIILTRVREHNAPLSDKLWRAVNQELGIMNAAEMWEEIAVRASVCGECGWQPCNCGGSNSAVIGRIAVQPALNLAADEVLTAGGAVESSASKDVPMSFAQSVAPFVIDLTDD